MCKKLSTNTQTTRAKPLILKSAAIHLPNLVNAWHWSVRRILSLWVRVTIKPDDAAAAIAASPRPVCYVLERESQTDLAVLSIVCARLSLPRPERRLLMGERRADKAYF